MTKKKLQERKKKNREKKAKEKVLRIREALREKQRYEKMIDKDVRENRERFKPFVRGIEDTPKDKNVREQIQKNMELLKNLEDEYLHEQEAKQALNADLETEGNLTLKQKLDALEDKAKENLNK